MLAPGTNLGAYHLISRIGAGGMGEVWKAEDTRLGRLVAIKILPASVAADFEAIARLRREARMAAQLNHPNIATIHAIEEAEGRLFIVMEFVEGEALADLMKRERMPEAELCRIGRSVADALAEAHGKGIVHRDIKPDNIIVSGARVKVLDFGIAKQVGVAAPLPDASTVTFMTQQGMILGTIHYMSPEQALGKPLDPRTDIFSLGVVLYEGATGQLPFHGETVTDTMTKIIRDEAQEPSRLNPGVSPGLNTIIQRCMRKNREERYATAADLGRALEQQLGPVLSGSRLQTVKETRRPSRWGWIAAAGVLVAIIGLVAIGRAGRRPAASPPARRPAAQPAKPPALPPPAIDAKAHLRRGETALFERTFPRAIEELQLALDHKDELDPRQEAFARLEMAIATRHKLQAEVTAREIARRWPGDPDLERIRREFGVIGGGRRRPRP